MISLWLQLGEWGVGVEGGGLLQLGLKRLEGSALGFVDGRVEVEVVQGRQAVLVR